jgi:hypothetical protein
LSGWFPEIGIPDTNRPLKNGMFYFFNLPLWDTPMTMEIYTLWLFNIAMGNDPFVDGLPIRNGGSFHGYVI